MSSIGHRLMKRNTGSQLSPLGKLVFNRTITLKDAWAKEAQKG